MSAFHVLAFAGLLALAGPALAATPEQVVRSIRDRWMEIRYAIPEKWRAPEYQALALQAHELAERNPYLAEPLVWEGIVLAAEAEVEDRLEAYLLARKARVSFEESLKLDETALGGLAYVGLARLHARRLLWPFGFGSKNAARAEKYFKKALAINPQGVDPNYFYGEYLYSLYHLNEARDHLERALRAPSRPGTELAGGSRREEIQALLAKIDKDLKIIARPAGRR